MRLVCVFVYVSRVHVSLSVCLRMCVGVCVVLCAWVPRYLCALVSTPGMLVVDGTATRALNHATHTSIADLPALWPCLRRDRTRKAA